MTRKMHRKHERETVPAHDAERSEAPADPHCGSPGDNREDRRKLTKREFMKLCCLGLGGCALGFTRSGPWLDSGGVFPGIALEDEGPGKWSKEALFYEAQGDAVQCLKCPHGCLLQPDELGICRNRLNYRGKLYSIAYGNPCAVHVDPIEKKPFFHFLPSTRAFSIAAAGCNLRCLNCQNWEISQISPRESQNIDLMPERVVEECVKIGCESIAYTYSEPTTFYEYALDTAVVARRQGIRNVLKSSGYINEAPLRKLCGVLDAANIDLKSFDERVYWELNGATLQPVLRTLKVIREEGVWLEITNLVIPTWTDNLDMIRKMCDWLCENGLRDSPIHFSRFTPMYKLNRLPSTPVATLDHALAIARESGMRYVYVGNVPGHRAENTFCHNCGRLVIERRGYVIISNEIKDGRCSFCNENIPGIWS
jgi:pyruvate formate lyase activating enzyme